ncbi:MAG: hypothetical protein QW400_00045 [Candidatus Diapherotrites archaeon]
MKEILGSAVILIVFALFFFYFFHILLYVAPFEELSKGVGLTLSSEDLNIIKECGLLLFDANELSCNKKVFIGEGRISCDLYFYNDDANFNIIFEITKTLSNGKSSIKDCNADLILEKGKDENCGIRVLMHGEVSLSGDGKSRFVTQTECEKKYRRRLDLNSLECEPYFETIKSINHLKDKNTEYLVLGEIPLGVGGAKLTSISFNKKETNTAYLSYTDFQLYEGAAHKNFLKVSGLSRESLEGIRIKKIEDWNCTNEEIPKCCSNGVCVYHTGIISFFVESPFNPNTRVDFQYDANEEKKLEFVKAFAVKLGKK